MNNYSYLVSLLLFVALIILVTFFIIFIKNSFYVSTKEKFSFMNRFPFESIYQKGNSLSNIFKALLILLVALMISINGLYISCFKTTSSLIYAIFIGIMYTLAVICIVLSFFTTTKDLSRFKYYSVLSIVFGILSNAMLGILSMSSVYSDHYSHKIIAVFAFILSLTNIALVFNPKLKDWDKLVEDKSSDGTIIYVRPKISPLAISLWISYSTIVLGEGLILINMLLSSLL